MNSPPNSGREPASPRVTATALFRQASAAGRAALNSAELTALLSGLGLAFQEDAVPAAPSTPVDLRISLNNTREFGMVLSAGLGGLDAELDESNFRTDRASVYAATELTDAGEFLGLFRRTLAYQRLACTGLPPPDARLQACFEQLLDLARGYSPGNPGTAFVLRSLKLNPVRVDEQLVVQAAQCEFSAPGASRLPRPIHKIDKLIHPASIGIIGVSASGMNFGRIILRNLMGSGYSKERMTIIRPGEKEIDGVKCIESLKALE